MNSEGAPELDTNNKAIATPEAMAIYLAEHDDINPELFKVSMELLDRDDKARVTRPADQLSEPPSS